MAESVTPESIDQLHSVNNYGGYHPTNGTITYSLKNTAEKNSFNIVLAPDTVLWNRTKEQELKDSLKIKVYTGDRTYQTISATPKITGKYNDTPSDNRAIQTGPRPVSYTHLDVYKRQLPGAHADDQRHPGDESS